MGEFKGYHDSENFEIWWQLMKWIAFADSLPVDPKACFSALNELNGDLIQKSVLLGGGLQPSEADTVVFSAIHSSVVCILHLLLHFHFHIDHA